MNDFELLDTKTLAARELRRVKFLNFLGLLNVAANRWMEGLPIRVIRFKK